MMFPRRLLSNISCWYDRTLKESKGGAIGMKSSGSSCLSGDDDDSATVVAALVAIARDES